MTELSRAGRHRIFALILGLGACALLVGGGELAARGLTVQMSYHVYPDNYYDLSRYNILQPSPGTHRVQTMNAKTNTLIDDIEYSVDKFGRRITPRAAGGGD